MILIHNLYRSMKAKYDNMDFGAYAPFLDLVAVDIIVLV